MNCYIEQCRVTLWRWVSWTILLVGMPVACLVAATGSIIGGIFLGLASLVSLVYLIEGRNIELEPYLSITREGIQDYRSDIGLIPWSDIGKMWTEHVEWHPTLCLELTNPDKYTSIPGLDKWPLSPHAYRDTIKLLPKKKSRKRNFVTPDDVPLLTIRVTGLEPDETDILRFIREIQPDKVE